MPHPSVSLKELAHPSGPPTPPCAPPTPSLTLTMASLVCAMSEMTPSVMMSSTEYWEPSCTAAAFLGGQVKVRSLQGLGALAWLPSKDPEL